MGKITFSIDDALEQKFRTSIGHRKGFRKGVLEEALTEAIELWLKFGSQSRLRSKGKSVDVKGGSKTS